ncbi:glycosyltransferase family 2 protein [Curvivirga sp.]|uniref:glycosyltransferase family 2 protein n=1 Tax=Curvivirga sp. TaxID=2856848 RepID=UPI003B5C6A00
MDALPLSFVPMTLGPHHIKAKCDLSFIVPAYNESKTIEATIIQIADEMAVLDRSFEILVVDDGSCDDTFHVAVKADVKAVVRVIRLSRNFGKENAISAGLEHCIGDAVFILDADLQEPISYMHEMLDLYDQGYEMIYAVRKDREDESKLKRFFVEIFYKMLRMGSDVNIPEDARDFRLMDRKVVDSILALPERNRFMKGLFAWVGFRSIPIYINMKPRQFGRSKFGLKSLSKLALTALTSFTNLPLRIWAVIGTSLASLSLLYGSWILVKTLFTGADIPGFATLSVAIFFIGGVQLISLGTIGEYLARVFAEVKSRPLYIVAEEQKNTPSK